MEQFWLLSVFSDYSSFLSNDRKVEQVCRQSDYTLTIVLNPAAAAASPVNGGYMSD